MAKVRSQIGHLESISGRLRTSNASQVCSGRVRKPHSDVDRCALCAMYVRGGLPVGLLPAARTTCAARCTWHSDVAAC
eukprot:3164223-Prymnesium_polylepis.1